MSSTFRLQFHRYQPGESRISGSTHFNAEDFADAHRHAATMVKGMEEADPASKFSILVIEATGFRGTDCDGGCRLFETREEFSARVGEEVR